MGGITAVGVHRFTQWLQVALILAVLQSCVALAQGANTTIETGLPKDAAFAASGGVLRAIRQLARPLRGTAEDYDALLKRTGDARLVMLGEDTHGSMEHYQERARITQRLVMEKGFNGLVIESDWAAVERIDRYVRGLPGDSTAEEALSGHIRFPRWMWRNVPFRDLIAWLRDYNQTAAGRERPVGVYGMDAQGLAASVATALDQLARIDPEAEGWVRAQYTCLEQHGFDSGLYAAALQKDAAVSCEKGALGAYDLLRERSALALRDERAGNAWFSILLNARLVLTAEAYARFQASGGLSWNVRDTHMADVVDAILARRQEVDGRPAKMVVWAHNTHIGDARATDRGARGGYLSVGQLLRERHAGDTLTVGFSTRVGTVRAAPNWGTPDRIFTIRRPAWESMPAILGRARLPRFMLIFSETGTGLDALDDNVPFRAIGTVYWPRFERREHYYRGALTRQFDAIVHIDRTQAVPGLP